jgi:hypothetical protein
MIPLRADSAQILSSKFQRLPELAKETSCHLAIRVNGVVFRLTAPANSPRYLMNMVAKRKDANIRQGETAEQFTARAEQALAEAKSLSAEISGNLTEVNRWMAIANPTMTWMEALYFSIDSMRQQNRPVSLEPMV